MTTKNQSSKTTILKRISSINTRILRFNKYAPYLGEQKTELKSMLATIILAEQLRN